MINNPFNLPVEKSKVLTEWKPNEHTFKFVDSVAIVDSRNPLSVISMDRIRIDNGERIYFAGITQGLEFIYVVKKYTTEIKNEI